MNLYLSILVSILLLLPQGSYASSVEERTLERLFEYADTVIVVEVTEGKMVEFQGEPCGVKYTGRVHRAFKGSSIKEGSRIHFGRNIGISVGERYLVFLRSYVSTEEYLAENPYFQELLRLGSDLGMVECGCLIPGLITAGDGVFELEGNSFYVRNQNGTLEEITIEDIDLLSN